MLFGWFTWLCVANIETLEDGARSWHTWPSARFPRTSLLELLLPQATLDSRCWLLLTLLRKPRSSLPNLLTEDWRWWPSSACSFRTTDITQFVSMEWDRVPPQCFGFEGQQRNLALNLLTKCTSTEMGHIFLKQFCMPKFPCNCWRTATLMVPHANP